ncbi:hypothetical protein NSS64_32610 [Paenibacillus sp. FSL H8-0122]|uniref:hypothetical protein n=1 Tax=Paenibacillus sp. FSL H8-0122 TaxID=2954510 RepID=UPI0030F87B84
MKTTGNLGLKKPEGTDNVDIADINGNMDILDTAVKTVQDHTADTVKHITAAERTTWNAKASTAVATTAAAGLMDAADKAKLDTVAAGANKYVHPNHTGDITSTGDGVTSIAPGVIVDADVNSAAAIAWSKLSKSGASLADLPTRSAADLTSGTLPAARLPAATGDVTSPAGSNVFTLTPGIIVDADVSNAAQINATKIGTGGITNTEFGYLDGVTGNIQWQLDAKSGIIDYVRQPAYSLTAGTGATYTVTLTPAPASIAEGFGITIVPHIVNAANPTVNINGLGAVALKDQKGVAYAAGKLLVGKPYMFRKVGTDFLADSAGGSGNAVAGDIRAGKTAATDAGDVIGTLPVQTGGTVTPGPTAQVKAAGIYDTAITVAGVAVPAANVLAGTTIAGTPGTMPNRANDQPTGYMWANGTGDFAVGFPKGAYLTDSGFGAGIASVLLQDPDFNPANIPEDINIFGLQGGIPRRGAYTNALSTGWDGNQVYIRIPGGVYQNNSGQGTPEIVLSAAQARADGNIVPSNIRNGTWIYGTLGTLMPVGHSTISTGTPGAGAPASDWYELFRIPGGGRYANMMGSINWGISGNGQTKQGVFFYMRDEAGMNVKLHGGYVTGNYHDEITYSGFYLDKAERRITTYATSFSVTPDTGNWSRWYTDIGNNGAIPGGFNTNGQIIFYCYIENSLGGGYTYMSANGELVYG